jgi:hypothetical protein
LASVTAASRTKENSFRFITRAKSDGELVWVHYGIEDVDPTSSKSLECVKGTSRPTQLRILPRCHGSTIPGTWLRSRRISNNRKQVEAGRGPTAILCRSRQNNVWGGVGGLFLFFIISSRSFRTSSASLSRDGKKVGARKKLPTNRMGMVGSQKKCRVLLRSSARSW